MITVVVAWYDRGAPPSTAKKEIGVPERVAMPGMTTLALAPTAVM
ncbi:hypothetical protein ACFWY9_03800 [Amycolatopsis sp. NPDC059027]